MLHFINFTRRRKLATAEIKTKTLRGVRILRSLYQICSFFNFIFCFVFFFLWSLSVFRLLTLHFNTYRLGSPAKKTGLLSSPHHFVTIFGLWKMKSVCESSPMDKPKNIIHQLLRTHLERKPSAFVYAMEKSNRS